LDGEIPRGKIPSPEVLLERSRNSLEEWISRLEAGKEILGQREKIEREFYSSLPEERKCGQFNENKFRDFNRDWSTKYSRNLHEELKKDPSKWHEYHELYREKRKSWEEMPYEYIASFILKRPDWVVGDFGCGDNLMRKYLKNGSIFSFDHVAIDESVIECDMAKVPLENDFLDVAVYSLSLMGRNFQDYLEEAKRVLKPYGKIFIAEPINSQKWGEDIFQGIKKELENKGFGSIVKLKANEKFIYVQAEKI
jgi:SAM-dependent methyltransferase